MAAENRDWGYRRIQGALDNPGHEVARGTIANILKEHGLEPAPERNRKTTWQEFLRRHWEVTVAADFFTVEVWTRRGLTRFLILFLIDVSTRRVEIAGIAAKANGLWMEQIARNLCDDVDGFLRGKRYLIHDRDPLFTAGFLGTLAAAGVNSVKLPPRSPNLNAHAERFVRTIKESCLERMILFGEGSLRKAIHEFVAHYHVERNHQGLENRLILPDKNLARNNGAIRRHERLGGMLETINRSATIGDALDVFIRRLEYLWFSEIAIWLIKWGLHTLRQLSPITVLSALLASALSLFRSHTALHLEIFALRHQLGVLQRSVKKPKLTPADRLIWAWLSELWLDWRSALIIVKPETVIAWHRKGFRLFWTWKVRHGRTGRPSVSNEVRELIRKLSRENPLWGAPRIHGELLKLGIDVGETSVGKYMVHARRPPSQTWRTFLENHVKTMVSVDFFTVPTIRFQILYVFLVLAHERRRIVHFNVTAHPTLSGQRSNSGKLSRGTLRHAICCGIAIGSSGGTS